MKSIERKNKKKEAKARALQEKREMPTTKEVAIYKKRKPPIGRHKRAPRNDAANENKTKQFYEITTIEEDEESNSTTGNYHSLASGKRNNKRYLTDPDQLRVSQNRTGNQHKLPELGQKGEHKTTRLKLSHSISSDADDSHFKRPKNSLPSAHQSTIEHEAKAIK